MRLQLLRSLPPAPMDGELDDPALTFGLAGMMSGVSFHTHGAVFAEVVFGCCARRRRRVTLCVQVLHGDKLWFLSPPTEKPVFDGNVTQMQVARDSPYARNPPSSNKRLTLPPISRSGCCNMRSTSCKRTAVPWTSGASFWNRGARCSCGSSPRRC
jgi:hypothetical protein